MAYIDVKDGATEGHVRCLSAAAASAMADAHLPGYTLTRLTGDTERDYWRKANAEREKRVEAKTRGKRRGRGRDKVGLVLF